MSITNREAYEGRFNDFKLPTTQHDEIATDALCKLYTVQEHLEDIGEDIAVLALGAVERSIYHLTNASVARNRKTYIYLAKLFDDQDMSVPKNLAAYEAVVNSDTEFQSPWRR